MGSKGLSHLINVRVGTGNSEVISMRVGEMVVGLGEFGNKEVLIGIYLSLEGLLPGHERRGRG